MNFLLRSMLGLACLGMSCPGIYAVDTSVVPTEGIWWSSENPGTGVAFNVDDQGRWFAAIYLYDNVGEPTFLTMQGESIEYLSGENTNPIEPPEAYARVVSPLIRSEGGQCLKCPWTQATASASGDGNATITFYGRNRAELSVGDWHLRLAPMLDSSNERPDFPELWAQEHFARQTDYYQVTIQTDTVRSVVTAKLKTTDGFGGTPPPYINYILECLDCEDPDSDAAEIGGSMYLQSFRFRCSRTDTTQCSSIEPRFTDSKFIVDAYYLDQDDKEFVLIDHGDGENRAPGRIELRALPADWRPALP